MSEVPRTGVIGEPTCLAASGNETSDDIFNPRVVRTHLIAQLDQVQDRRGLRYLADSDHPVEQG